MKRERLTTHVLAFLIALALGSFLLFRRGRMEPPPGPSPATSQGISAGPGASGSAGAPTASGTLPTPPTGTPLSGPAPLAVGLGKLVVHLSPSPPVEHLSASIMILSKTSGLLDSHRNLEDELVATFDLVPAGAKIVAVIPHSSLVGPAYAESFLAGDQTVDVVVPIVPGQGVDGVVVDLKGAPVKDARVTAALNLGYVLPRDQMGLSNSVITTSTDGTGWSFSSVAGYVSRTVVTDAEGRFRVENTGTRPLSIWAESGSLRSLSQSTVPGAQVRLILQR